MIKIAYTSDLHLEFLDKNLRAQNQGAFFTIPHLAEMFCNALKKVKCDFAVVAGDTSHCVLDIVLFFSEIDKRVKKPIYVVLGNHDYWNWPSSLMRHKHAVHPKGNVKDIETWMREKFANFKQVELVIAGDIYTYKGLKIIGDCGFAIYNRNFNYLSGIYRGTITKHSEEKHYTHRWMNFYRQETEKNEKTLVITHHPPSDWNHDYWDKNLNHTYIFGHIHDMDIRRATGKEIVKRGRYFGDAGNGYNTAEIVFKTVEIE